MGSEIFSREEADRLVDKARALDHELLGDPGDAEVSGRGSHIRLAALWREVRSAYVSKDMGRLREKTDEVGRVVRQEFERRGGGGSLIP